MSPAPAPALEQALAARQSPGLFVRFRERPLPHDLGLLLRIAANETAACDQACAASGESLRVVAEAAVLYVQQVMFHPGSDSYRILGVNADAPEEQIREHRRWLLRWLHPDRNSDAWNGVYVNRVTLAWQDLRSSERRADYDARMASNLQAGLAGRPARVVRPDQRLGRYDDEVLLSARATRRLPVIVLGTLAIGSISMLGLEFYLKNMDAAEPLAAEVAIPPVAATERLEPTEPLQAIEAAPRLASKPPAAVMDPARPKVLPPAQAAPRVATAASAIAAPEVTAARESPVTPALRVAPIGPGAPIPTTPSITKSYPAPDFAPAAAADPQPLETSVAPIPPVVIDDMLVAELLMKFRQAYASGKLDQVRGLLVERSPDAAGEQKAILDTYERLFDSSRSRRIDIRNVSWFAQGEVAVLLASYEAWIELRGDRKRGHEAGDIRFDLRREGGSLRIARLRHAAKGG